MGEVEKAQPRRLVSSVARPNASTVPSIGYAPLHPSYEIEPRGSLPSFSRVTSLLQEIWR